jgi:uncharacterized protein YyaL (SSP411 family)
LREPPGAALLNDQVDRLTAIVLDAVAAGDAVDPTALTFLLRQYLATATEPLRQRVADSLGPALAIALDRHLGDSAVGDRADWLTVFSEAAAVSEDDRLHAAARDLLARVLHDSRSASSTSAACRAIDACLRAAAAAPNARDVIVSAIDQLEHVVGRVYRPGEGVAHDIREPGAERGALEDQLHAADVLLTAHGISGRLPYAMLAEELMQSVRRRAWDDAGGGFFDVVAGVPRSKPFAANCDAVRVLSRLAALRRDDDFRAAAVVAPGADYDSDAARVLEYLSSTAEARGASAAALGLALTDYLNVK